VVSVLDAVFQLKTPVTAGEINAVLKAASQSDRLKGILDYTEDPVVSCDIIGNPHSSIVDGLLTTTVDCLVKVVSWYDNEWGYANRVVDLAVFVARH
jgi:glyceraldehyde 3-phosphate dehydrogenase